MLILVLAMVSAGAQNVKKGDANGDQVVDAKDVTEVSNALMGNPSDKYIKVNADANSDEKVNAADVVTIINMIFTANLRLVILKKDGIVLKFDVADKPKVSYSGNDLVLTTTKTTVQLPVYLLQKISFENSSSE